MGRVFYIIGILFCLISCNQEGGKELSSPTPYLSVDETWADSVLAEMTLTEKIGQLLILKAQPKSDEEKEILLQQIQQIQPAGLLLENIPVQDFLSLRESGKTISKQPLFLASRENVLFNNQFSDLENLPEQGSINSINSDSLNFKLLQLYLKQAKALGINFLFGPETQGLNYSQSHTGKFSSLPSHLRRIDLLNQAGILNISTGFNQYKLLDSNYISSDQLQAFKDLVYGGLSGIHIDKNLFEQDSLDFLPANYLSDYLNQSIDFNGLKTAELTENLCLEPLWNAGVDLIVADDNIEGVYYEFLEALLNKTISEKEIDHKVKLVLLAKSWQEKIAAQNLNTPLAEKEEVKVLQASLEENMEPQEEEIEETEEEKILDHFQSAQWAGVAQTMHEDAITLASNPKNLLPFSYTYKRSFRLIHYGEKPLIRFKAAFGKYANFFSEVVRVKEKEALPALRKHKSNRWTHIITLDNLILDAKRDSAFIKSMRDLAQKDKLVLINFGREDNLRFFDTTLAVVQIYDKDKVSESLAAQLLFGGIEARGKLPYTINEYFKEGTGIKTDIIRLKYGLPQEVGISPEKLVSIDAIAKTAIKNKITPGCQVLVAKNGNVIYSKPFGYHTYDKKQKVRTSDLYDVASLTKVAATTLATMKLYEQKKITLKDKVRDHLDCGKASTIKNIPVKKLLNHSSGLPPSMPIAPYLLYRDQVNNACDSFFCKDNTDLYTVPVADNFYLAENQIDSIWKKVYKTNYRGPRRYRYSDVNFMLLQKIVESHLDTRMDEWLNKEFYHPLGLRRNLYNPLEVYNKDNIIPTQNDKRWRHQQIRGYVHDEAAALFGGVGGNAGLFSTAEDLAVLFQLLLNKGEYGGKTYFNEETVKLFTNTYHGNHRGLGFDKPTPGSRSAYSKSASSMTFGHTGFTGTCVWADPKHDLVFIFLSNRIYPDVRNRALFKEHIRERIHSVVYDALDSYKINFPVLDHKPSQKI